MNKIQKLFFILTIGILFASCGDKGDDPVIVPPRDYAVQYEADIDSIGKFINTHYITVDADFNTTFTKIPVGGTQLSIRLQTDYPLDSITVNKHDVDYKVYYLKLREGANENPSSVDSVYVSYKGNVLSGTQFDYAQNPIWFKLDEVVTGWAEIIPLFKTGDFDTTPGPNPATFTNYGAGVMFLPSGLAYFNVAASGIPSYSPLIFSFKLNNQRHRDHDKDGILSKDEVDPLVVGQKPADYDSDGDGYPNMYDLDDDGDNYLTKNEIKYINPLDPTVVRYYPFNGALVDDPATPFVDETQGIPACGNLDFTSPTRLRKHLDSTCH